MSVFYYLLLQDLCICINAPLSMILPPVPFKQVQFVLNRKDAFFDAMS